MRDHLFSSPTRGIGESPRLPYSLSAPQVIGHLESSPTPESLPAREATPPIVVEDDATTEVTPADRQRRQSLEQGKSAHPRLQNSTDEVPLSRDFQDQTR